VLQFLRLKNIAIVSELELEFDAGMNIITGETGSGKSLLLRGLELLRGGKASADLVRAGSDRAEIEAQFILTPEARERTLSDLREDFEWADEVLGEEEIVLRRTIDANGRGKIAINGRLSTRAELETVSSCLFDITGQHSQQRLLDEKFHRLCLDQFGVSRELLTKVRDAFEIWHELARRYEKVTSESSERVNKLRSLTFERDELSELALRSGEREELELELKRASSLESLTAGVQELLLVFEGEDGVGLELQLGRLEQLVAKLARLDPSLVGIQNLTDALAAQSSELRLEVERYASSLETDPERLEALRSRLSDIARIERKYGRNPEELIAYLAKISEELALHESGAYDLEKLQKELSLAREKLTELEQLLTADRKKVAVKLAKAVEKGLAELDMKRAKFSVNLSESRSSEFGADLVQFYLAANPGEPSHSLSDVASGGELSRLLLVLKNLLNEQTTPVLQIFDEIDVGVGGATSQVLGEKLKSLSPRFQVIAVTHAPQIAALGDKHIVVSKESTASRTNVVAQTLSQDERVMEIARMLAGKDVTEQFVKSAKELLK